MKNRKLSTIRHPDYNKHISAWQKYRYVFESGDNFVNKYLKQFSRREDFNDYLLRRAVTPIPAFAKAGVLEIRNAIYQRMADIVRKGGNEKYRKIMERDVDLTGNSIDSFMGRIILPELISIGKVAICIDKDHMEPGTKDVTNRFRPYLYHYIAEDILSWYPTHGPLESISLRAEKEVLDSDTGLIIDYQDVYRQYILTDDGVIFREEDKQGHQTQEDTLLKLSRIPIVILELSHSLLTDVANYQIALLNINSSDVFYLLMANFPFYTEQVNPSDVTNFIDVREAADDENIKTDGAADTRRTKPVRVGTVHGRQYGKDLDRPDFIAPPTDPIMASIQKQNQLRDDLRMLMHLSLASVEPRRASAESKQEDVKGLEAGLSYIGLELEYAENQIAQIWQEFEGTKDQITISYPDNYSLRSDDDRQAEAERLEERMKGTPSVTLKKELAKRISEILLGGRVDSSIRSAISKEIDQAVVIITDPETVRSDHEAGFVSTETASSIRGYPKGEVEQAKIDHAERAKRIAEAQSSVSVNGNARGLPDLGVDDPDEEKRTSQSPDNNPEGKKQVRGKGK